MSNRRRLPNRRASEFISFVHEGLRYTASLSRYPDGRPAEIFLDAGRYGTQVAENAQDSAILASLALQSGIEAEVIRTAVRGPISRALEIFSIARK